MGKLCSGKERKKEKDGFRYCLLGGYWHKEAASGLTRSGASYVIGFEGICGSL